MTKSHQEYFITTVDLNILSYHPLDSENKYNNH